MQVTVHEVMEDVAALLNDTERSDYTDEAQLPYFRIAWDELREEMELNNVPVTNKTDTQTVVNAGVTEVPVPPDLIETQGLYERPNGIDCNFSLMIRKDFLPNYVVQLQNLVYWTFEDQKYKFIGATLDTQLKIEYICEVLPKNLTPDTVIKVINAKTALKYRTAGLCAEFIGENPSRAQALNTDAQLALNRFLGISTKAQQVMAVRRRPFMNAYKRAGGYIIGR